MIDGYQIYCEWCRDHNRAAPSREWWDRACAKGRARQAELIGVPVSELRAPRPHRWSRADELDSAEIEREAREGWVDVYA